MRFEVVKHIYEAALKDKKIHFITGDLGHLHAEDFKKSIPGQYLNGGLAEQNIVSVAAGLALSGMKVFVYSIVPFITLRCFEQLKVDVCYQNVDVTVIGVGGGFSYGPYGGTHNSIEDIAIMRSLPNMKVVCPANPMEAGILTREIIKTGGPAYIRIEKGGESNPEKEYEVNLGKGAVARKGNDITIFSTGSILNESMRAADILKEKGIDVEVVSLHTVKPIDEEFIRIRVGSRKAVFSVEEHSIIGGLGGAMAEVVSETSNNRAIFKRFGVNDAWPKVIGSQKYLRDLSGISAEKIAAEIIKIIK